MLKGKALRDFKSEFQDEIFFKDASRMPASFYMSKKSSLFLVGSTSLIAFITFWIVVNFGEYPFVSFISLLTVLRFNPAFSASHVAVIPLFSKNLPSFVLYGFPNPKKENIFDPLLARYWNMSLFISK